MKTNCLYCRCENPKHGMKTCSRKCADELKKIHSRENRICLFCKCEFEVRKKDIKQLCSEDCRKSWAALPENIDYRINASKEAVKEKFGVDNVFQLESIKEKSKETKLEKYGDKNYNNKEQQVKTLKKNNGDDYYIKLGKKRVEVTLKKHGVEHHLQLPEFINKQKQTNLKRHGVENVSQKEEFKRKRKDTIIDKFGVENVSQNGEIKKKKKATSMKNFRVSHHLKDYDMFQKHQKTRFNIKKYKDTDLIYNGSYEKYFLELLEEKGLLKEVSSGQSFEYEWKGEKHIYHTDFAFRGKQIEIKSGWTYNKNGTDIELQNLNEAKWSAVKNNNVNLVILIDKREIIGFIKAQ